MKVLGIIAAVVLLAVVCGVQTQYAVEPKEFWEQFYRDVTAEVCGDIGDLCTPIRFQCLGTLKPASVDTEEDVNDVKVNITECASRVGATEADFSTLTLERVNEAPVKDGEFDIVTFLSQYGVADNQVAPIAECYMEKNGELDTLRTCIANNLSEST